MPAGKPAYIWSGTEWIPIGLQIGAKYQPGQPSASASTTGDLWIDSNTNIPYVWNGTSWAVTSASVNLGLYLTTASASALYAPLVSPSLTGIPTAPTASVGTDNTQIATTAFVYDQAPLFSNRNLLYNGAMQIHQRSASVAGITTTNYYTADRWNIAISSLGTWTQTVENDAPTGSGFRKSQKMLCTVADTSPSASDYLIVSQIIEGQDVQRIAKGTASAQQLTLSFWVKSNIVGTYIVNIYDYDNTRWVAGSYTISASATWERKIITFSADSTGVLDNDNAASLSVDFWLGAGSTYTSGSLSTNWNNTVGNRAPGQTNLASAINNYWQITGVQLEVGPNASQFEFKKYEQDLSECQRYYIRQTRTSSSTTDVTGAFAPASSWTSAWQAYLVFPVTMRSVPILGSSATSTFCIHTGGVATSTISSIGASQATVDGARLGGASNYASTSGFGGQLCAYNATAFLEFNAEL